MGNSVLLLRNLFSKSLLIKEKQIKNTQIKNTTNKAINQVGSAKNVLMTNLKNFINSEIENLSKEDVLSKLTINERLIFLTKVLPYVLPKIEPLMNQYDLPTEWDTN